MPQIFTGVFFSLKCSFSNLTVQPLWPANKAYCSISKKVFIHISKSFIFVKLGHQTIPNIFPGILHSQKETHHHNARPSRFYSQNSHSACKRSSSLSNSRPWVRSLQLETLCLFCRYFHSLCSEVLSFMILSLLTLFRQTRILY